MDLGEGLKKVFLAGVGAVATTAETAKEIVDDLVTKGELTVEQGKVLNEELKRNTKQKIKNHVTVNVTREYKDAFSAVEHMNAEELAALKEEIRKAEEKAEKEAQEKAEEEAQNAAQEGAAAAEAACGQDGGGEACGASSEEGGGQKTDTGEADGNDKTAGNDTDK